MAGKPVVLVTGASGSIGAATVSVLAEKYADKVEIRAGVRNPDKIPARHNVTVVKVVMGDKDQLKESLKGVDALYIVTPGTENRVPLAIRTAEAAKEAGVKFILVVSVPTVIFPDTTFGKQMSEIENQVSKLGIPYSFLRLPLFVDNIWASKDTIVSQSTLYVPQSPDKPAIYITVEDAAKAGAAILANYSKHNGKGYTIQSDRYTNAELAAAFTEALGKEVKFIQVSPKVARQGMVGKGWPEWQVDGILELWKLIEEGAPVLTAGDDGQALKSLTGEEPISMKAWVTKNAPGFK